MFGTGESFIETYWAYKADILRLLALELGRPVMIDERDCAVDLPSPLDDPFVGATGVFPPTDAPESVSPLLVSIYVMRLVSQLTKTLIRPFIVPSTLRDFDRQFDKCISTFPPHLRVTASQYLDPGSLVPMIYLQNARMVLHRHNLSPVCARDARSRAIDECVAIAKDTFRLLSRTMQAPAASPRSTSAGLPDTWQSRLATAAFSMLCTHIWRCVLFLCFRGEYSAALLCVRVSAAIDEVRPVNAACGQHLTLFLDCLVAKLRRDKGVDLEDDEELVVYLSGDLQSSSQNSWIWQGSDPDTKRDRRESHGHGIPQRSHASQGAPGSTSTVIEDDTEEWSGWERVEWILQHLTNEQQQQQQNPVNKPAPQNQGDTGSLESRGTANLPRVKPGSSSRISIANII